MGAPVASVEIQAKSTGLRAQLREARAKFGQFADGVASKMGGAFAKLGNKKGSMFGKGSFFGDAARTAGGNIMSGALTRATDFFEDVGKDVFDFEDQLTRLRIQGNETPETMAAISKSITDSSNKWGVGRSKILGGATAFVTLTGRVDVAQESVDTFAKTAIATGSDVNDLGVTAAAAFQNMGIKASEFESFFSGMTAQGKMGAVELKDLASELSTIAPQWSQFASGKGLQGARELGAALQIVKRGFGGDAAETVTGLNNFLTAVTKKSARFRDNGVASFFNVGKDDKGRTTKTLKSVFQIVDIISKSKLSRDPEALTKALGSSEAYRAFIQLRDGRKDMEGFVKAAQDNGVIQRDAATYLESSTGRVKQSWEQMKNTLAQALTPERIEAAVSGFQQMAEFAGVIAKGFSVAADFFGGFKKAGQDIRGYITGEGHITMMDRAKAKVGDPEAIAKIENIKGHAAYAQIRAADSERARGLLGINATSANDLAAQYYNAQGEGAVAKKAAAEKYFKEMGMTPGVTGLADQFGKMLDALTEIRKNTEQAIQVKIGADPVATAAKDAPKHRRGVAK